MAREGAVRRRGRDEAAPVADDARIDGELAAVSSARHVWSQTDAIPVIAGGAPFIVFGALLCFAIAVQHTLSVPIMLTLTAPGEIADATGATWATFLPFFAGAVAAPIMARLSDLHGRRTMLVACLAAMAVGSIIGPLGAGQPAETVTVLIGRGLQGVGFAAIPVLMAAAREMLSRQHMLIAVAVFGAVLGTAGGIGAPLGSLIYESLGWRAVFWISAVCALALLAVSPLCVPPSTPRLSGSFDVRGAILLSATTVGTLLLITQGSAWGGSPMLFLATLGLTLLIGATWVVTAWRTRSPVVNVRSFRQRGVVFTHLAAFGVGFGVMTNTLITGMQLQRIHDRADFGWLPLAAVLILLPLVSAMLFTPWLSVLTVRLLGVRALLVIGAVVMLAGFALRLYVSPNGTVSVIWSTVIALGAALALAAIPLLLNRLASMQRIGAINGMNWTMHLYGLVSGAAVVIGVGAVAASGSAGAPSWQAMWVIQLSAALVAVAVVAFAVLIPLPDRDRRRPR